MKYLFFVTTLFYLFIGNTSLAIQNTTLSDSLNSFRTTLICFGLGFKYHPNSEKTDMPQNNSSVQPAFIIEIAKDFWNSGKNYLGIEIIGHKDTYGTSPMLSQEFSFTLDILYKRRSTISKFLTIDTDFGLGIFSNDVANLLSPFISLKLSYFFYDYELFIKNNFRTRFPLFNYDLPWILTTGLTIKL